MRTKISRRRQLLLLALVAGIVLIVSACAGPDRLNLDASVSGDLPQNALDPAGPEAQKIDNLWWLVFWIATAIFVVVEAALLFTVFRFRRRGRNDRAERVQKPKASLSEPAGPPEPSPRPPSGGWGRTPPRKTVPGGPDTK